MYSSTPFFGLSARSLPQRLLYQFDRLAYAFYSMVIHNHPVHGENQTFPASADCFVLGMLVGFSQMFNESPPFHARRYLHRPSS